MSKKAINKLTRVNAQPNPYRSGLSSLPGLGPKRSAVLEKELGEAASIEDLLYYFPRRYLDRNLSNRVDVQVGQETTLLVQVTSVYLSHGRSSRLIANCLGAQGLRLTLVWFRGARFLRTIICKEVNLIISGKLEFFKGLQMAHPDFEIIDPNEKKDLIHTGRIIPLYSTSESFKRNGLDSRGIRSIMRTALDFSDANQVSGVEEILPQELLRKYDLIERHQALCAIHFPTSMQEQEAAYRRLKYEELYLFQILMYHKSLLREKASRSCQPLSFGYSTSYKQLIEQSLPFPLTGDQEKAIKKMLDTIANKSSPCAFLLQGDVGSGKTLVALGIALHYLDAGIQSVFLAPTEILARQHYLTLHELMGLQAGHNLELLTGKETQKQRLVKTDRIIRGEVNIVIGTHALLETNVVFKNLGMVIIDEQHRFGVRQRQLISSKGNNPDTVAMSATPIPRSLCLTEFADLELILLKEKPVGRKPIQSMWLSTKRHQGIYTSIRNHVRVGRQCYIVYPLIEESEKVDMQAASVAYEKLSSDIFPEFHVALLHGRMKKQDKEKIMQDFRSGHIQILVTTSVIEVGVDVPNATIMVIEHAERFGISQLHQLRGRVGRGTHQSHCVFVSDSAAPETRERLEALVASEDGFYLAEMDLSIRGSGEVLGLRQHGLSELRLADLVKDKELVQLSYADARAYPELAPTARDFLCRRFAQGVVVFPN